MSSREKYTVSGLSTERGSAGLEMILWTGMLILLIMMPLICFLFETYHYGVQNIIWINRVENLLDSAELQLDTVALASSDRRFHWTILQAEWEKKLLQSCNPLSEEEVQVRLEPIPESNPPCMNISVNVRYLPTTFVGFAVSKGGKLEFSIHREREFPYDR